MKTWLLVRLQLLLGIALLMLLLQIVIFVNLEFAF